MPAPKDMRIEVKSSPELLEKFREIVRSTLREISDKLDRLEQRVSELEERERQ